MENEIVVAIAGNNSAGTRFGGVGRTMILVPADVTPEENTNSARVKNGILYAEGSCSAELVENVLTVSGECSATIRSNVLFVN